MLGRAANQMAAALETGGGFKLSKLFEISGEFELQKGTPSANCNAVV